MDPPPEVVLEVDSLSQLNTADARSLLDTIDGLRDLGVGNFVQLPQIIVVGDQSSGKSSVLEAISRVRFPVDGDLCTRFATELVLRRAPETAINVRIQFADTVSPNSEDDTGAAGTPRGPPRLSPAPFQRTSFDKDALPDIIREAKERMGITNNGVKRFSKDVLRVEVTSPDVYPLTLVDLPGIFHSSTAEQNEADKNIVNALIESYMEQAKSIILLVVAANQPLANQAVLSIAARHDPGRERTIGVITKPDIAGHGSSNEKKYLDLAKGRESMHRLALGWYVLRNRSEDERSSGADVRDTVEERFFKTGEWNSISPANRGIDSLRKRLSKVLLDHIKKNLPNLIDDIETRLRARQRDLTRAGKPRSTPEELRSYLLGIAEEFQRLVRDAVEGRYSDPFFGGFDQDEMRLLKLRALLRNMNSAFSLVMDRKGASYKIQWEDAGANESAEQEYGGEIAEYLQPLYDLYNVPDPEPKPESELNALVQSLEFSNRGREFPGDTNPELVFLLFKKQSAPWEAIAQKHLDYTVSAAKEVVHRVFRHVTGTDDATLHSILHDCVDPFFADKEEALQNKLREIIAPYKNGHGPPLDSDFRERLQEKASRRFASQFATRLQQQHPELFRLDFSSGAALNRDMIMNAVEGPSKTESNMFDAEKVIDRMVVYYEMSRKTFVTNIISLAIESCLVRDLPTIFTPTKIDGMDSTRLQYLASETEDIRRQRQDFEQEVTILREGLRKCQKHKPRQQLVLPSTLLRLSMGGVPGNASRDATSQPSVPAAPLPYNIRPAVVQTPTHPIAYGQPPNNNTLLASTAPTAPSVSPNPWLFSSKSVPPFSAPRGASGQSSFGSGFGGLSGTETVFGKSVPLGTAFGTTSSASNPFGTTLPPGAGPPPNNPFGTSLPPGAGPPPNNTTAANSSTSANTTANSASTGQANTPATQTASQPKTRSDLAYPGIELVPLRTPGVEYHGTHNKDMGEMALQSDSNEQIVGKHISFQEGMRGFSEEELRLREIVGGACGYPYFGPLPKEVR